MTNDIIRKTLTAFVPAIQEIDDGCIICVTAFIRAANKGLTENDIPFQYTYTLSGGRVNVSVVETELANAQDAQANA